MQERTATVAMLADYGALRERRNEVSRGAESKSASVLRDSNRCLIKQDQDRRSMRRGTADSPARQHPRRRRAFREKRIDLAKANRGETPDFDRSPGGGGGGENAGSPASGVR